MKLVQHPNVVRLYEVIDTHSKLYLILELGDGGDMYDHIMRHEGGLAEGRAKHYFAQIVHAISYCHKLHVVHRDLKPENVVFFQEQGVVKLTDFGFSNRFQPGKMLTTSCGSLAYSAPEILLGDEYDAPAVGKAGGAGHVPPPRRCPFTGGFLSCHVPCTLFGAHGHAVLCPPGVGLSGGLGMKESYSDVPQHRK
uniref:non-specific serine/threonine protein kinase n=1 Tax=Nothoprocta perdicaria TaxID=30464 RepID=A0A8C6Z1E0_NOTPE